MHGTRSVQLGQVMSRHARRFMPLLAELPRTFQVDPARSRRTTGSLPYLEKKTRESMDRVETLTFFFPLSILSCSTFFVCTLSPFLHLSVSLFLYHIFFFFLKDFVSVFLFFFFIFLSLSRREQQDPSEETAAGGKGGGIRKKRGMQRLVVRHSVRGTVANNAFSLLLCASLVASKNFAEALLISLARKLRESVWRIFRNADPLARSTSM